jgi:hypothetical protein
MRELVGDGKHPAAICRRVMASRLPTEGSSFLQAGDVVRLTETLLAGHTNVLISQTKLNRVLIRVTLIQQVLAADGESEWCTPRRT